MNDEYSDDGLSTSYCAPPDWKNRPETETDSDAEPDELSDRRTPEAFRHPDYTWRSTLYAHNPQCEEIYHDIRLPFLGVPERVAFVDLFDTRDNYEAWIKANEDRPTTPPRGDPPDPPAPLTRMETLRTYYFVNVTPFCVLGFFAGSSLTLAGAGSRESAVYVGLLWVGALLIGFLVLSAETAVRWRVAESAA